MATTTITLLRPLEPTALTPDQYTGRSRALTLLRRIECIEVRDVVKRSGARHYVIDIHYKHAPHGIPTNRSKRSRPTSRRETTPDVRLLRRFSEFTNLGHETYFHAHTGHATAPCAFCSAFMKYIDGSVTQPRLAMKLLYADGQVRHLLEWFLNDIVRLTVRGVKAYGGRECLGQEHVPQLLLEFLLPHEAVPELGEAAINMSVQGLRVASEPLVQEEK